MQTLPFAKNIRKDFPILKHPLIYFDSAATTQKPQQVIDAMGEFYANEYGTVHRGIYQLSTKATEKYNHVRQHLANFLGAKCQEELVFTRGTTDSINLVAQSYGHFIDKGDEIIVSEMEHHSNLIPWQFLCKKKEAILKVIPINNRAEIDLDAYQKLLSPKTKLVAIAHIANSTGTINPIEQIIELAHNYKAKVLIDAAQSTAHHPINVKALDIDFLALSAHKAFGPTGIGALYGKYELLEKMPPIQGGGDMVVSVNLKEATFQNPPLRFEAGTPPITQVIGFGAALEYIETLGIENIRNWEQQLLQYATEKLLKIPHLRIIGTAKEKAGIISFIIEKVHHLDLATLLDLENIAIRSGHHCAQPLLHRFGLTGTCRISFSPFNTFEEIDIFVEALQKAIAML